MLENLFREMSRTVLTILWRTAAIASGFLIWAYGVLCLGWIGLLPSSPVFDENMAQMPFVIHGLLFAASFLSGVGFALLSVMYEALWRDIKSRFS